MSKTASDFLFNVGETEEIRARQPGLTEEAKPTKGLALRVDAQAQLRRLSSGLFHRNKENEIFFITTAFDMSGDPPQSYPEKPEDAENVWILAAGESAAVA